MHQHFSTIVPLSLANGFVPDKMDHDSIRHGTTVQNNYNTMKAQKADVQRYVIEVRFLVDDFSFHAQTPPPHYAFCLRNTHTCSAYSRMQGLALSRMRGRGVECNAVNTQPILPYKHYRCSYLHKRSGAETFSVRLNNHTII